MSERGRKLVRAWAFRIALVLLIAATEWSLALWALTLDNNPTSRFHASPYLDPAQVWWTSARGSVGASIPRDTAGRYPYDAWNRSLNGFIPTLRLTDRGTAGLHMRVLMITIPWWLIILMLISLSVLLIKRHGLEINWPFWRLRRERRGFEPIMTRQDGASGATVPSPRYSGERVRERGERRGSASDGGAPNN